MGVALPSGDTHVDRPRTPLSRMAKGFGHGLGMDARPIELNRAARAGLRLAKKAAKPSWASACIRSRASRGGRLDGCGSALLWGDRGHIANQRLGLRLCAGRALEQRLDETRAARVEQVGGSRPRGPTPSARGPCGQSLGGQEVAPRRALADLAEHERRNHRGNDPEAHFGEGELRLSTTTTMSQAAIRPSAPP